MIIAMGVHVESEKSQLATFNIQLSVDSLAQ